MIVNFNYDWLVQATLENQFHCAFDRFDSYIENKVKLIQLHGSSLWYKQGMKEPEVQQRSTPSPQGDPILTLPTTGGISQKFFACPESHSSKLMSYLPTVNVIIIIGWQGNEPHFNEYLKTIQEVRRIIIVSGNEEDARATLRNSGLKRFRTQTVFVPGFSCLLEKYPSFDVGPFSEHMFSYII